MKSTLVLVLAVLFALAGVLYLVRDMFSEPFEKKYERRQIDALVASCRADAIGEDLAQRCTACDWIVDVQLRRQAELEKKNPNAKISFLQMLHEGATFYPDNWKHEGLFIGRSVTLIGWSWRYRGWSWDDVKQCVLEKLKRGIDATRCATKYTRFDKRYSSTTDEAKAARVLASTMDVDPKLPGGVKMRFLCPRPQKQSLFQLQPPSRVAFLLFDSPVVF